MKKIASLKKLNLQSKFDKRIKNSGAGLKKKKGIAEQVWKNWNITKFEKGNG